MSHEMTTHDMQQCIQNCRDCQRKYGSGRRSSRPAHFGPKSVNRESTIPQRVFEHKFKNIASGWAAEALCVTMEFVERLSFPFDPLSEFA